MQNDEGLITLSWQLGLMLAKKEWTLATAESCTGGMLGQVVTAIPGSSQWYEGGVVSYSNAAKQGLLGVDEAMIAQHGAVSDPVVRAMVGGVAEQLSSRCAIAITGVAGPTGGSVEKPVGTVWMGWEVEGEVASEALLFKGGREAVRRQAVKMALLGLLKRLLQ